MINYAHKIFISDTHYKIKVVGKTQDFLRTLSVFGGH